VAVHAADVEPAAKLVGAAEWSYTRCKTTVH
jgi:hypothetical protein